MTPLHNYSHYSVLDSVLKPKELVKEAKNRGFDALAITDISTMAGVVQFHDACADLKVKPILGVTLRFVHGDTFVLIAKNLAGYQELLKITSLANSEKKYINYACLDLEDLKTFDLTNLLFLTGHEGSSLYKALYDEDLETLIDDGIKFAQYHLEQIENLFGKSNCVIQFHPDFSEDLRKQYELLNAKFNWKKNITTVVQYVDHDSTELYNIVKATQLKTYVKSLPGTLYKGFLPKDLIKDDSDEIANSIEAYEIKKRPELPTFKCPNGKSSKDYVRELCWESMKRLGLQDKTEYRERISHEIGIVDDANMLDYFLIIRDILQFATSKGCLVGPGRGSAAGCLMSYLLNITQIDPLKYNLIFERFYSAARKDVLPDIDIDVPKRARDDIIKYIAEKYGQDHTAQVATYQTLMGRAALKAVFRALNTCSFQEMNEITKLIEDKAKISDELQQMKDAGLTPSVLLWALENRKAKLIDYCFLRHFDADGYELEGKYAKEFDLAIQLEGIKSSKSKHASAIIVGKRPLGEMVPMIWDEKTTKQIVGMEFEDAEKVSLCKLDVLGLQTLDKIMDI